ncbi:(2Fe-2S)-binding protein [Pseudomonas sp. G.S.17]|uniref:(2Fe-2S)-binding protein n=1 Tax=Pseudomonas TaxID=286 RepID=UPI0009B5721D|nr:(2Fe-2S)-binding protein [Pseudomonas syringae]
MPNVSLFNARASAPSTQVSILINGHDFSVPEYMTVAAALLSVGITQVRETPVSNAPRAPFCMMGACFECLVEIDGVPNQQACMTLVKPGMTIRSMIGARSLK